MFHLGIVVVFPAFIRHFTRAKTLAITLFPFIILADAELKLDHRLLNHERIHIQQQLELFFVFFYLWYVIEFVVRYIKSRDVQRAYRSIGFEREAYVHESDEQYLWNRTFYGFLKYLS